MNHSLLDIEPEVAQALAANRPVVALESTIISHGMPYPQNLETARRVERQVRDNGAVPATIAIIKGRLKVGLNEADLEYLAKTGLQVTKASRRDIPFLVAAGRDGATTVASTMIIAAMAGIRVFATGGIGGVHRGAPSTFDVSADLQELANTQVAVVCAGIKSILDLGLTLEYLETHGVAVVGYQTDQLPAFYSRDSDFAVDYRLETPSEIAAALNTKWQLALKGGMIIANPIPEAHSMPREVIDQAIDQALAEMEAQGVSGKASTPFLLARVAELTGGNSLDANIELVLNNAALAARVAADYSRQQGEANKG